MPYLLLPTRRFGRAAIAPPASRGKHNHTRTLETLEYTIGADAKLIRKLIAFSKKRNVASYDSAGSISDQELDQILSTVEDLRHTVETWLRTTHPELLGQS